MAIDLSKTREIVLFEIDRKTPHDLYRFHRAISRAIASGGILESDFEEVLGAYDHPELGPTLNVAYCMGSRAFDRLYLDILPLIVGQIEIYRYGLDALELRRGSVRNSPGGRYVYWTAPETVGFAVTPRDMPMADDASTGFTYFPSSGETLELLIEEAEE